MPLEEPSWWYGTKRNDARVGVLKPISHIYAWAVLRRLKRANPYTSSLPVFCIGNFTAGGTGKTPLSLLIAELLIEQGHKPAFLTRGYSGSQSGPVWVNPKTDSAADIGDEPLLLAEAAPTMVARDRAAGARAIEAMGSATHIIMDDGLQNPTLTKTLTIAVVDGVRGLGNGEVIPAGPLRAPLEAQLELTDAIVVNGGGSRSPILQQLPAVFPGRVLSASVEPQFEGEPLAGARVIAYAGIGNPGRFTSSLTSAGAHVIEERFFKDHHSYSVADARELVGLADSHSARLMTTEKDLVRLRVQSGALTELAERSEALRIKMVFEASDLRRLKELIAPLVVVQK